MDKYNLSVWSFEMLDNSYCSYLMSLNIVEVAIFFSLTISVKGKKRLPLQMFIFYV